MIETVSGYNPFRQVRRVQFSATFELVDQSAADNATITSTAASPVSRDAQLLGEADAPSGKFVSLERNLWLLDGSLRCIDTADAAEIVGLWALPLSGEDGAYSIPPYVQFDLSQTASSFGFTLFFDTVSGSAPETVETRAYRDGVLLASRTDMCGEAQLVVELPVENYNRVIFSFPASTMPRRRVRVVRCVFGIVKQYDATNTKKATLNYGVDPTAASLPTRQLSLTIDNSKREYNMRNPNSIYAYLQEGQEIRAVCTIDGVPVDMGLFRFTSATAKDSGMTAVLQANDCVYGLDSAVYIAGSHDGEVMTLQEAVGCLLAGRGIECQYGDGVASRQVRLSPPKKSSVRETLRLLAQAARCAVWVDRANVLRFADLQPAEAVRAYTFDDMYSADALSVADRVSRVVVDATNRNKTEVAEESYSYGSGDDEKSFQNQCVAPSAGAAVAKWLHGCEQARIQYDFQNRCDPAVEVGDTISVADAFGGPGLALVTAIDITYNGGLSAVTEGVGA